MLTCTHANTPLTGYIRGVCVVLSCYYMPTSPVVAMLLYMTNVSLDELDGRAARRFKQTSQFGALLDTITDRLADSLPTSYSDCISPS